MDIYFFIKTLNSWWFQILYFNFKGNCDIQSVSLLFLSGTFLFLLFVLPVTLHMLHWNASIFSQSVSVQLHGFFWLTSMCVFCSFCSGTSDSSPTVWRHILDWFYPNVFPLNGNCVFHKWSWQRDTIKKCFMSTVTHGCSSSWHLTIPSFFVSGFG